MIDSDLLYKCITTPGLCSMEEIIMSKEFLENLRDNFTVYVNATNNDKMGETFESLIENLNYFIK